MYTDAIYIYIEIEIELMCIGNALNYLKNCIVIYSYKKDPPVCKQLHMILHIQIKCVLKLLYLRNSSLHMQMYL